MIQEILTFTTVTGAIIYTLYSFGKILFSRNQGSACGGGCVQCEAKNLLMKDINKPPHRNNHPTRTHKQKSSESFHPPVKLINRRRDIF
jgi:hypothetical protein